MKISFKFTSEKGGVGNFFMGAPRPTKILMHFLRAGNVVSMCVWKALYQNAGAACWDPKP